jgi:release factor glutamine methyltransferase
LDRAKERPTRDRPLAVADVGTGSGILAICAAKHLPGCHVTAVDISRKALAVAAANAADHNVWERIEWIESDLLAAVPAERRFDFVVSNPPYVAEGELASLAPEVKNHEPRTALIAGPKGTEVIQRLVGQAADRLEPGGWLLVEINPALEPEIQELLAAEGRFTLGPTIKDLAGLPRVVQAQRK